MLAPEDPLASKGVLGTLEASFGWNKKRKKYKKRYIIATELLWSIKEQKSYLVVKQ